MRFLSSWKTPNRAETFSPLKFLWCWRGSSASRPVITLTQYLSELRLALASSLLAQGSQPLDWIAEQVGLGDAHQLRRVWRRYRSGIDMSLLMKLVAMYFVPWLRVATNALIVTIDSVMIKSLHIYNIRHIQMPYKFVYFNFVDIYY